MQVKVPQVERCCCCFPLRYGIMIFGIINIMFSLVAVACLVLTTEMHKSTLTNGSSLEEVTSTVLFSILGMNVLLNVILLVGGCQKDMSILRLYNVYAVLTTLAALVPVFILLSRRQFTDVYGASLAIVMQIYVIILVRSEVMKLEKQALRSEDSTRNTEEEEVIVSDSVTLL